MEQHVLMLYLSGCSYAEIAKRMGITQKAADNALQRVRQKLKKQT
jgi:RNA polymerase sporulation-specific sigma factor